MKSVPMPECDKMLAVKDKSQAIGEFLEWLQGEQEVTLAAYGTERNTRNRLFPIQTTTEAMLADFFGINLAKVEQERRALLAAINAPDEGGESG